MSPIWIIIVVLLVLVLLGGIGGGSFGVPYRLSASDMAASASSASS